jgi:uncharacterized protein (TIGR00251 family)
MSWAQIYRAPVIPEPLSPHRDGVLVRVWVVPRASRSEIVGTHGGRLKVRVTAPPEAGRANEEVARLLGEILGTRVELQSGATSREKTFLAFDVDLDRVAGKLTR